MAGKIRYVGKNLAWCRVDGCFLNKSCQFTPPLVSPAIVSPDYNFGKGVDCPAGASFKGANTMGLILDQPSIYWSARV